VNITLKILALGAVLLLMANIFAQKNKQIKLSSEEDTVSYCLGLRLANNLKSQGYDINIDIFMQAFKEIYERIAPQISLAEANTIVNEYGRKLQELVNERTKLEGEKFLEENKKKKGVITLPSGLQYEVIKEGTGKQPTINDKVKTHYHGTLIDGTVFDSSVERGEPISFPLKNVIQGWQEGLQLMKEGAKYRLFVPYNLAYKERGAGALIKPFSALIFEVELIAVETQE